MATSRHALAAAITFALPISAFSQCDTGEWLPPADDGSNGPVLAFTSYQEQLAAAGAFTLLEGTEAGRLAVGDGVTWAGLGDGPAPIADFGVVHALVVHDGQLYAGGFFQSGADDYSVTRWDGSSWQPVPDGPEGFVYALASYDGELVAAGDFRRVGGAVVLRIAAWDGKSWHGLDNGIDRDLPGSGRVLALHVHNGELIAGGIFAYRLPSGANVPNIVRWNGSSWSAVGPVVMNGIVEAITTFNGDLVIGGSFQTPVPRLARLNSGAWHPLGPSIEGSVYSFLPTDQGLFVGGAFASIGTVPARSIALWDGAAWSALGAGIGDVPGDRVDALALHNGLVYAGGSFEIAGDLASPYLARWRLAEPGCPADFDCSGAVDSNDFFGFLAAFFTSSPAADFNRDGVVDSQDFFAFLTAFFSPC